MRNIRLPEDDALRVEATQADHALKALRAGDRATVFVEDTPQRRDEEEMLTELGVDPEDPELDTAVRELEAGVTEDLPFGTPGPPMSRRSPFLTGFTVACGVLTVVALAWAAYAVADILLVVLVAGFLATGLDPAVCWVVQGARVPRGAAVAIVLGLLGALIAAFAVFGVPTLVAQANELREDAPRYAEQLRNSSPALANLDERVGWVKVVENATSDESMQGAQGRRGLISLAVGLATATIAMLTCLTLTVYFVARYPSLKRNAYKLVPRSRRARATLLMDEILQRIGRYLLGNLATSAVAGVVAFVVLRAFSVPNALALAILVALMDMIPLVGATIGAAICVAIAFTVSVATGISMIVFFVLYQQFENLIFVPRVMQRTVEVSPVATIVAILIGAALLGVIGAMLAVPVAAALQLIGRHVWVPRQEAR